MTSRRKFLKTMGAGGLAFAWPGRPGAGAALRSAPAAGLPNFVFILADDLGY